MLVGRQTGRWSEREQSLPGSLANLQSYNLRKVENYNCKAEIAGPFVVALLLSLKSTNLLCLQAGGKAGVIEQSQKLRLLVELAVL